MEYAGWEKVADISRIKIFMSRVLERRPKGKQKMKRRKKRKSKRASTEDVFGDEAGEWSEQGNKSCARSRWL